MLLGHKTCEQVQHFFVCSDATSAVVPAVKSKPVIKSDIVELLVDAQLDNIEIAVMDQSKILTNMQVRSSLF